ncbi:MAG: hypothetical protein JJU11_18765, partial [Candidatus Sumerlaeia bacterium]|nr:hypothetical protein [Candidatus Sumerlaeia bacterium]
MFRSVASGAEEEARLAAWESGLAGLPSDASSLLLEADGTTVLVAVPGTIGRQVGWFVPAGHASGQCEVDYARLLPTGHVAALASRFTFCDPHQMAWLTSPVPAQVTGDTGSGRVEVATNADGTYTVQLRSWMGSPYMVHAAVRWAHLNRYAGRGTVQLSGVTGTLGPGSRGPVNFAVDLRVLSWPFRLSNELLLSDGLGNACTVRMGAPSASASGGVRVVTTAEGLQTHWPEGHTVYGTGMAVQCAGAGCTALGGSAACGGDHEGLLEQVEAQDLFNTSVYVFRESDGRLIGQRWGLDAGDLACDPALHAFAEGWLSCRAPSSAGGASGELRFSFRGPSLQPRFAFSDRLVYEAVDLEETAQHANPVRVGDALRVVVVNHATGYMGTAHTVLGSERGEVPELEVSGGEAGRVEVVLRPPNLRVWAERTWTVSEGGTAGEGRRNVLGTEGSALVTDETLTVYTEWLDADGTALPMGLPGFTGRLARVIGEADEDNPAMGRLLPVGDGSGADEDEDEHVGMFEIRPGRQTQVLQLPREDAARRSHFYVHVSGTSLQEGARGGTGREPGPSFAVNEVCFHGRGSGSGSMRCVLRAASGVGEEGETPWMGARPMRLVPVLTPKHNAVLTLARRQAALALGQEDPGPVIEWVYRPEAHFTLLELESLQVGRRTAGGLDVPMLGDDAAEGDATFRGDDQWLWGDFGWEGPEEEEDLGRFSGDRALGMYIGDTEGATDADGRWIFLPEQLGSLDADDYATLRVAQRGDEGNTLWEFAFEVERLELVRRYHRPVFDGGHPQPHLDVPVDDYRILEIALAADARISAVIFDPEQDPEQQSVSLLRDPDNPVVTLDVVELPAVQWLIPWTYGEGEEALEERDAGPESTVEIH